MGTNGNQWGANGKAVGRFKSYLPFVINGNSMVNYRENWNGIFYHSEEKKAGHKYPMAKKDEGKNGR